MIAWFKFFRIVNLPTVPGDVLVGAAGAYVSVALLAPDCSWANGTLARIASAALASAALYLYGLADNDIVGAATDRERPIPRGEISPTAARVARGTCLAVAMAAALGARLPTAWWIVASGLLVTMLVYNRTKVAFLMGLCRGLDVFLGAAAVAGSIAAPELAEALETVSGTQLLSSFAALVGPGILWTAYIAFVTRLSEGEDLDPRRRARVGQLIGGLVYLQLVTLLVFALLIPATNRLLLTGAILLIILRLFKRLFPKVSAS